MYSAAANKPLHLTRRHYGFSEFNVSPAAAQVNGVVRRRRGLHGVLSADKHPVAWAMLMYELADAHEHLGALVAQMQAAGGIDEPDFAVQLGHVFAHLSRAWHGRADDRLDDQSAESHTERSRLPTDLPPVG